MTNRQTIARYQDACRVHQAASPLRVYFVIDPDARFEECNGEARPLTETEYAENPYNNSTTGERIPYAEYLRYYGNPDRHVYLGAILESRCRACGCWTEVDSLWGIDVMDDQPEAYVVDGEHSRHYAPSELEAIPGYLRDVARDMLAGQSPDTRTTKRSDADLITDILTYIADDPAHAFGAIVAMMRREGLVK